VRQKLSEITATSDDSSRWVNSDPAIGCAPSTRNRLAVMEVPRTRSGSPTPVSVTVREDQAPMSSIVEGWSRHAR
jgi:hypothetical protein